MTDDAFSALERQLGSPPPDTLAGLSPRQLEALSATIEAARRRQAAELAAAGDHAFNHIPRLLRGPIRKVLR